MVTVQKEKAPSPKAAEVRQVETAPMKAAGTQEARIGELETQAKKQAKKTELLTDAMKDVMEKGNPKEAYGQLLAEEKWQKQYTTIFGVLTAAALTMVVVAATFISGPVFMLPLISSLAFGSNTINGFKRARKLGRQREQAKELSDSLSEKLGKIEKLDRQ